MASIEKRSGDYRVRYRDPSGCPRSNTFLRKTDADRFAREVEVDKDRARGSIRARRRSRCRRGPRHSSRRRSRWRRRPSRPIAGTSSCTSCRPSVTAGCPRLNAEEIEQWLGSELARGLSPSSVHRHYRTLRRVVQAAVEKDRLLVNPCAKVRPPRVAARPMAILAWAQSVALAEAHPAHLKPMIYLALDSGMRWSELVGLRRGQVDLARHKVRVTEQLLRVDTVWLRRPPKTSAGVRSITISAGTAAMLGRHLADRPLQRCAGARASRSTCGRRLSRRPH
jgi:integrase